MALNLRRRHDRDCPVKDGNIVHKCECPLVVQGRTASGKYIRQTLEARDFTEARREAERIEKDQSAALTEPTKEEKTIEAAKTKFLADLESRVTERTFYKYELLFRGSKPRKNRAGDVAWIGLEEFAAKRGFHFLKQFDRDAIGDFRNSWPQSGHTKQKQWERLRQFFKFAHESGWIDRNPTVGLKRFKPDMEQKEPFDKEEMRKILAAADKRIEKSTGNQAKANALRLRALVFFLRYSGLRIGDATSAAVASLADGKLSRYTQKTGTHVSIDMPPEVVQALEQIPPKSERYWFWSGTCSVETEAKHWQMRLSDLFRDAGIKRVGGSSAHRFRHTFAHAHLAAGGSMEDLSRLLGHTSIKVTEKYYAKWSKERQTRASEAVRRTWENDPILAWERATTPAPAKAERAETGTANSEDAAQVGTRLVRENRKSVN